MAEIVKCACGNNPHARQTMLAEFRIGCWDCGFAVIKPTEPEAIAAWNRVMRPRPVVEIGPIHTADGFTGSSALLPALIEVGWTVERKSGWEARCHVTGEENESATASSAHTWLIAKLTAAGFDVESETK